MGVDVMGVQGWQSRTNRYQYYFVLNGLEQRQLLFQRWPSRDDHAALAIKLTRNLRHVMRLRQVSHIV